MEVGKIQHAGAIGGAPLLPVHFKEKKIRGLDVVRVNKESLVEIIKQNRKDHRAIFEEALENWQKAVTKALEEAVEDAKKGTEYRVTFGLIKPRDHTSDYDRALKMLNLSLDDELELSEHEFAHFVMDDWGWQKEFLASSSAYVMSTKNRQTLGGKFSQYQ